MKRCAMAILALAALLGACTTVGPGILRNGRPAYNDAILATNDEQLLQNIVRLRFVDSVGFLAVSAVTANVSIVATGSVNVGIGPSEYFQGNLVPFAGTVTTEQNPTISYVPVSGDRMMRQFLGEIPLDLAVLLINAAQDHRAAWHALFRRLNDIRNPEFIEPSAPAPDGRFEQIARLGSDLQRRGVLYWVRLAGGQSGYAMVLHSYSPANSREVAQFLDALRIAAPAREGEDVVVPVQLSVGSPQSGTIAIETRSLFNLMQIAAASIELPADLAASARAYPERGPAARDIRILSSASRPSQARVAVEYRGRWYYIDETDHAGKQWFLMLQLLSSAQMTDANPGAAPLLTIPVSRR
jgi:hypothetical protein